MLNDGNYNYYNREPTRSPWSPQPHQGDATIGLDQIERSTHAVLHQFLTSYPDSNHPGCDQLRQLTVLLKDPVFREIYKFNCENKELFKSQTSTVISSTLPDNFYRYVDCQYLDRKGLLSTFPSPNEKYLKNLLK